MSLDTLIRLWTIRYLCTAALWLLAVIAAFYVHLAIYEDLHILRLLAYTAVIVAAARCLYLLRMSADQVLDEKSEAAS